MSKRVRISNESVNCYGTRILTSGMDLTQYQRNPVLLYMHERGTVVGMVKDVKVEGTDVTGELVFDEATDLSKQLKKQWEFGSLKMVSANIQIVETSDDKTQLAEGQTRPTITRSKLFEVSVVDIGGNDDALVLSSEDGKKISLAGQEAENPFLPLLNSFTNNKPQTKEKQMELKTLALQLGLAETSTESEVNAKVASLMLAAQEVAALKKAVIGQAVDTAISEKRIQATAREQFVELGKKVGLDELKKVFAAIQPQMSLASTLNHKSEDVPQSEGDFSKYERLSAVPANKMEDLHDNHPEEFERLYKAEYGLDI